MGWRSGVSDRTEWRGEEKALWRGYQPEERKNLGPDRVPELSGG